MLVARRPFNSRASIAPMTWKNVDPTKPDWYVPPRSRCLYSVLVMHRRKDLWGPDGACPRPFVPVATRLGPLTEGGL